MSKYTNILPQVINELGNCYPIWAIYTAEYNVLCLNLINGMVSQIGLCFIVSFRMHNVVLGAPNPVLCGTLT